MASSSRLGPGEKGKISVSIDLKGKMGKIIKTVHVYTNDPGKPEVSLTLNMYVKDSLHMKEYRSAEIFSAKCKACHVDKGRGEKGAELFMDDCVICHNAGKNAPSISEMRKKPKDYVQKVIREGVDGTAMPGWDAKHGGPLTEDEIRSLVGVINPSR